MKKEDYQKEKELIKNEITALQEKLKKTESAYIEANREFEIGEKVVVIYKKHKHHRYGEVPEESFPAFVIGHEIDYNNNVVPVLNKCKKDGTMSKHRYYLWLHSGISIEKHTLIEG